MSMILMDLENYLYKAPKSVLKELL